MPCANTATGTSVRASNSRLVQLSQKTASTPPRAIRRAVAESHQLALQAVALVPAGTLPKTTSGKLQRFLCRTGFLEGALMPLAAWHEQVAS